VKGEALAAPAGRADDFAWPRREIGREQAKGDVPMAATSPAAPAAAPANPPPSTTAIAPDGSIITAPQKPAQKRIFRPAQAPQQQQQQQPWLRDFFGFGGQQPQQRPLAPPRPPRPPGNVGRSASAPGNAVQ
jgi:hypothetical protein